MKNNGSNYIYIITLMAAIALSGCSYHERHIYSMGEEGLYSKKWCGIIKEYPIGEKENIRVTPLFKNEDSSHYIIQLRGAERPHIHEEHDLTVILKKGDGTLHLGKEKLCMKAGDMAFIPRGTVHYFVNKKKSCPAVSYVIFSPAYHGKDKKIVEEGNL